MDLFVAFLNELDWYERSLALLLTFHLGVRIGDLIQEYRDRRLRTAHAVRAALLENDGCLCYTCFRLYIREWQR